MNSVALTVFPSSSSFFFVIVVNFAIVNSLQFRFLHAFCVLRYGEGINHWLDITSEETAKIMSGISDTMIGNTSLWEVVCTDLCRAVTCRDNRLTAVCYIVNILLMLTVILICTQTQIGRAHV